MLFKLEPDWGDGPVCAAFFDEADFERRTGHLEDEPFDAEIAPADPNGVDRLAPGADADVIEHEPHDA